MLTGTRWLCNNPPPHGHWKPREHRRTSCPTGVRSPSHWCHLILSRFWFSTPSGRDDSIPLTDHLPELTRVRGQDSNEIPVLKCIPTHLQNLINSLCSGSRKKSKLVGKTQQQMPATGMSQMFESSDKNLKQTELSSEQTQACLKQK